MRIIDWSSDVCSSDLDEIALAELLADRFHHRARADHLGRVDRHARRDDVGEFGVRTLEAIGRDVREIVRDRRHFGLRGLEAAECGIEGHAWVLLDEEISRPGGCLNSDPRTAERRDGKEYDSTCRSR